MLRLQGKRRSNLAEMFLINDQDLEEPPPTLTPPDPSTTNTPTSGPQVSFDRQVSGKGPAPCGGWAGLVDTGACPRWAAVGVLAVVVVGVACGMGVYAAFYHSDDGTHGHKGMADMLQYFNISHATDIHWVSFNDANLTSLQSLLTSQSGSVMVTVPVTSYVTKDNMTEPVVLSSDGDRNVSLPLRKLLDFFMLTSTPRVGLRCDVIDVRTSDAVLRLLRFYVMVGRLRMPLWVHGDVIGEPENIGNGVLTVKRLSGLVQKLFPQATLSLGWSSGCSNISVYTPSAIEDLWNTLRPISNPVSFRVCLDHLGRTYPLFHWLLAKDPTRFSLGVYSKCDNIETSNDTFHDLIEVRNDLSRASLFLDVADDILATFKTLEKMAGMPTHVFPVPGDDAALVRWSRATNSRKALLDGRQGNDMLVGDVTSYVNRTLWMGRRGDVRDMTLRQWLGTARNADVGVKIHIRSDDAITPTLTFIQKVIHAGSFNKPIWIHADIYEGQDSREPIVHRREFKQAVGSRLPFVTVCLGWTTGRRPGVYTEEMVGRMLNYAKDFKQPVVLVVRASVARASWGVLMTSLDKSRGYKLLIWADDTEHVSVDDLVYLHEHSEVHRVFYSLPATLKQAFVGALNSL